MIFKVQRTLFPRDEDCLVYNETQSVLGHFPVDDSIRDLMGDKMKGYYNAVIDTDGNIVFDGTEAKEQSW